jgi:YjbE family integral membrane protein
VELFSAQFFSALFAIIVIDLILAGDNAIVIALAARSLPPQLQKRAIVWGTGGAIAVRILMTLGVVWLLTIPGLRMTGGLLLLWIAYRLIVAKEPHPEGHSAAPRASFFAAMKTIVIADALMGLDNVLAIAGAAQGSMLLVVLGLLISVPIMVYGSTIVLKWIERLPWLVYAGAGVLAWTAANMVIKEPLLDEYLAVHPLTWMAIYALSIGGVLGLGLRHDPRRKAAKPECATVRSSPR